MGSNENNKAQTRISPYLAEKQSRCHLEARVS